MILKMPGAGKRGLSDKGVKPPSFESEPAVRCNIIDFEVAKLAMNQAGNPERKWSPGTWDSMKLPNLVAEDWFEWTALCALFGAVALFPFLAILLFG